LEGQVPEDNTSTVNTSTENKTGFSLEYVQELRGENASYRTRAKDAEARAQQAQQDADAQIAEANRTAQTRVIRTELRAEALRAGLLDADDLKLADVSQLNVNEDGEVSGVIELVKALKQAKPYLFSRNASTSQAAPAPGKTAAKTFDARQATAEELAADAKARGLNIKLR
jgi:hypothetical protein